jgi:hypothetical protein
MRYATTDSRWLISGIADANATIWRTPVQSALAAEAVVDAGEAW